MIIFAEEKATENRFKFQKNYFSKIKKNMYEDEILFYFSKSGKFVNFTIFDYFLCSVDFSTKYIQEKKKYYPSAYAVYEDFAS